MRREVGARRGFDSSHLLDTRAHLAAGLHVGLCTTTGPTRHATPEPLRKEAAETRGREVGSAWIVPSEPLRQIVAASVEGLTLYRPVASPRPRHRGPAGAVIAEVILSEEPCLDLEANIGILAEVLRRVTSIAVLPCRLGCPLSPVVGLLFALCNESSLTTSTVGDAAEGNPRTSSIVHVLFSSILSMASAHVN